MASEIKRMFKTLSVSEKEKLLLELEFEFDKVYGKNKVELIKTYKYNYGLKHGMTTMEEFDLVINGGLSMKLHLERYEAKHAGYEVLEFINGDKKLTLSYGDDTESRNQAPSVRKELQKFNLNVEESKNAFDDIIAVLDVYVDQMCDNEEENDEEESHGINSEYDSR